MEIFAAIDVGSYELSMKIFEISEKNGVKELDYIRHRIDLGTETYATGRISLRHIEEIIHFLDEYKEIMESYGVTRYQAYGTSALRETDYIHNLLDLIQQRTGLHVEVLSNSEQRFLDYKSIALKGTDFENTIGKPTAIVDIGGGSIQISLFNKDSLVATQNLKLGVLRLQTILQNLQVGMDRYQDLIAELVNSQLSIFSKMYLSDRKISNIIVIDDYISPVVRKRESEADDKGYVNSSNFTYFIESALSRGKNETARKLNIPEEHVSFLYVSGLLMQNIIDITRADTLWFPGVTLCDGIAFEYADKKKFISPSHDFEQDIIECAKNISKRYMGSKSRQETLEMISLTVFDTVSKRYGLTKRDRLLLDIAAILHDCGKYISMMNLGDCSYNIIMSTEIIGLSHREREIVANVVRYNHEEFESFDEASRWQNELPLEDYLRISKLTAILRIANGLDRTHRQKFRNVKVSLNDTLLEIYVDTMSDTTLERGLFKRRSEFFEQVYGIKPVIRQKRNFE